MAETLQFTVEMRPVASLRANPANYNRHSADQLGRLADSLRVHGQAKPLVITADGELLAGHGLWEAMRGMGWGQAACHVYHGQNAAAYLIADNWLATLAEPDEAALAAVLKDLEAAGWERLMTGEVAQAICTDPPYAINYLGGRAAQEERISAKRRGVEGQEGDAYWDDLADDEYRHLLVSSLGLAHQHSDHKAPLYLWFASSHLRDVLDCLAETGWQERNLLVWAKNNGTGSLFAQYKPWFELVYYCFKRGKTPRWYGDTTQRTLWAHDKPLKNEGHPTIKPLALIERTIVNSTEPGMLVVDAFLGSGTAIIAAEQTGRVCYGMEIAGKYVAVTLDRWQKFTGQEPVSELTGRTWTETKSDGERQPQ